MRVCEYLGIPYFVDDGPPRAVWGIDDIHPVTESRLTWKEWSTLLVWQVALALTSVPHSSPKDPMSPRRDNAHPLLPKTVMIPAPPIRETDATNVAPSKDVDRLLPSDIALALELVQFAVEEIHHTIVMAEQRNHVPHGLREYADDAARLLTRLTQL